MRGHVLPAGAVFAGSCLGAGVGLLLDRFAGEPPAPLHPVAGFGSAMGRVERALWADSALRGLAYTATGAGAAVAAGAGLARAARNGFGRGRAAHASAATLATMLGVGTATWLATAERELARAARRVAANAAGGDLAAARAALRALVGRDCEGLDEAGILRAVVESVAENTTDAVVAPLLWAACAGAPGVLMHRAVNTMDAMVGHRSERYRRFGWASARADDVLRGAVNTGLFPQSVLH